eukprot:5421208-Pyramimonas_sp.AAC.1
MGVAHLEPERTYLSTCGLVISDRRGANRIKAGVFRSICEHAAHAHSRCMFEQVARIMHVSCARNACPQDASKRLVAARAVG